MDLPRQAPRAEPSVECGMGVRIRGTKVAFPMAGHAHTAQQPPVECVVLVVGVHLQKLDHGGVPGGNGVPVLGRTTRAMRNARGVIVGAATSDEVGGHRVRDGIEEQAREISDHHHGVMCHACKNKDNP